MQDICSDPKNSDRCEEKTAIESLVMLCMEEKKSNISYEEGPQKSKDQAMLTRSTLDMANLITDSKNKLQDMTKSNGSLIGIQEDSLKWICRKFNRDLKNKLIPAFDILTANLLILDKHFL